ncbi:MAG TPA: wax ester/triacylglycerol synthase family O-acyltransferase [Polyangiales bacterium]|nr:wax ester/triacylglycerol synthase family O-acyltransferase [Polyangiales bacterium]
MLTQLTEQDASFLYFETAETPEHVGGLNLVASTGDPGEFYAAYRATIAGRMHLIPFLHQKLAQVPWQLDRPFWVEDDEVDLDYHIRRETLPKPGSMKQLEELVGRLHSALLDRTRPLWEFYVIDGLETGELAIYTKIHHAAMDGASSQALVRTMYDPTPLPRTFPPANPDQPHEHADLPHMIEGVLAHLVRQEIRAVQSVPHLLQAWTDLVLPNAQTLRFEGLAPLPITPRTLLNVGITNQRVYAARSLPLTTFKHIAKLTNTKINDVVLAVCSAALRGYLLDKNALPARSLTASVPIAVRETADETTPNQNGMFLCSLASDIADPLQRLAAIHTSSSQQKERFKRLQHVPLPELTTAGGGPLLRQLVELYGHSHASEIPLFGNLTISNVPGPNIPLYIAGARVVSLYPCSIPFHGAALNITAQSYNDRLDFGLIGCRRALPDLGILADLLSPSLLELHQAVLSATSTAQSERTQP